ncbi:hypothetical protein NU08_4217 [Flavobacterium anhuiense]|jgi:hypothetical protein|uniref:Uncharacterized protein n=1 Tax=Flavobacterium anhuiense TaxID=459526 RepID=A0A444VT51_9FLAO|nr:hypothetical protein [Flavobacterium anhuiense]RYJ36818.1 hypothetical protein NU08_4217 [Flavobacterium anhuiense]
MSRRKDFNLTFSRTKTPGGSLIYYCDSMSSTNNQSLCLATILSGYHEKDDINYLIENITLAQNGQQYEDFHQPDSLTGSFELIISPPNIVISPNNHQIPLQACKELLNEWLEFISI